VVPSTAKPRWLSPSDSGTIQSTSGRLAMSDRQQLVALRVVDQRLVLHVLHWPAQWRACPAFDALKPPALNDVERLSVSLAPLRMPFEWSDFQDDFVQKLTDLLSRKVTARQHKKPAVVVVTPDAMLAALQTAGYTRCEVFERGPYAGVEAATRS